MLITSILDIFDSGGSALELIDKYNFFTNSY